MQAVTEYFSELVQIDSPSGSEQKVARYLQAWLDVHGFETKQDDVGNLYARRKGIKTRPPFLLCAHMDTVQPGVGIVPVLKDDGYFYSAGDTILGADDKASIAAILTAVERFVALDENRSKPLEILFTVKEETGGGVENFPMEWIQAKNIVISDLARPLGILGIGAPFIINFTIELLGKAAHSSLPDKGVNTFLALNEILTHIPVGALDEGMSVMNIGKIEGGTTVNTIPGKCLIQGEIRSFKQELFEAHMRSIETVIHNIKKNSKVRARLTTDGYSPGYLYEESHPWVQQVAQVLQKHTDLPISYQKSFGVSDANIFVSHGFDTVVLSDGVEHPHTVNERVAVQTLEQLSECIFLLLKHGK